MRVYVLYTVCYGMKSGKHGIWKKNKVFDSWRVIFILALLLISSVAATEWTITKPTRMTDRVAVIFTPIKTMARTKHLAFFKKYEALQ